MGLTVGLPVGGMEGRPARIERAGGQCFGLLGRRGRRHVDGVLGLELDGRKDLLEPCSVVQ